MNLKVVVLLLMFSTFTAESQSWQQVNDFPSAERDDGVSFVIGEKAYCGTGYLPWFVETLDFYSYNMSTDAWNTIAGLPASKERQYACGFSSDSLGFIFGGISGGAYLNELWCYHPATDSWTEKTALPAAGRRGAACFVINNMIYIVGGRTAASIAVDEVWAYDLVNDSWQQQSAMPFGSRSRASGAALNNKGYLIFGTDENDSFCNELLEYNPVTDSWSQLISFPGSGRSYSTLSSISGDLVIIAGVDTFGTMYNDMWRYSPVSSAWQQLSSIPAASRKGGVSFNNADAIYYTTGITESFVRLKETWKCVNPTTVPEINRLKGLKLYPNPANEWSNLELKGSWSRGTLYSLLDCRGATLAEQPLHGSLLINLSGLSKGIYMVHVRDAESSMTIKLVRP